MAALLAVASVWAAPRPLDGIAAVVNDEVVTSSELDRRVGLALTQLKRQNIPAPSMDVLRKQVLERLILDLSLIHI